MNTLRLTCAGMLCLVGYLGTPIAACAAPVDEARTVLDRAVMAFNGRDYPAYADLLDSNIEAYAGVVTPFRFVGKDDWMAFIRGMADLASVTYRQHHSQCRAYNDDLVLCNGYFVFTTVDKNGRTETQNGRESTTLVRLGGRWLIANFHFSAVF